MSAPVRTLHPGDEDAVDTLLRAAFPGPEEAALVRALRAEGRMNTEMVSTLAGQIVSYAALSRLAGPEDWLALAPVATDPAHQRKGLATDLVRAVLAAFTDRTLVVLGKPSFYTRCGFSQPRAARLTSPYPIKNTLIARPGDDIPQETLIYPPAFDGV